MPRNLSVLYLFTVIFLATLSVWGKNCFAGPVALLSVSQARVYVDVSYDEESDVYRYDYTLVNSVDSKELVELFAVDISTLTPVVKVRGLLEGDGSLDMDLSPQETVQIAVESPENWYATLTYDKTVEWVSDTDGLKPGKSLSGFVIYSKSPPGQRGMRLSSDTFSSQGGLRCDACGICFGHADCSDRMEGVTVGPMLRSERSLIDSSGKLAHSDEVPLQFSNPQMLNPMLPSGSNRLDLAIVYGTKVLAGTLTAKLNNEDISNFFHVIPGGDDVVPIALSRENNVLSIYLDSSGRGAQAVTDIARFIIKVER